MTRPKYYTTHQYEPLRAPASWGEDGRQFVIRLTSILDDIYRRYGRLSTADLGNALNGELTALGQAKDTHEGRLDEIDEELAGRAEVYAEDLLETDAALNARVEKTEVIGAVNASTETDKIGHEKLSLTGVVLGGLHMEAGRAYTDGGVEITDAAIKIGGFSITKNNDGKITLACGENSLVLSLADTVTGVTANAYIDPDTGILKRITTLGG